MISQYAKAIPTGSRQLFRSLDGYFAKFILAISCTSFNSSFLLPHATKGQYAPPTCNGLHREWCCPVKDTTLPCKEVLACTLGQILLSVFKMNMLFLHPWRTCTTA